MRKKWILLFIVAILIAVPHISFCIQQNAPRIAFLRCFEFMLPEDVDIITCRLTLNSLEGKFHYSFEIIANEEDYGAITEGLDQFARRLSEKGKHGVIAERWVNEEGNFFDAANCIVQWQKRNPSNILFYKSTYNSVGFIDWGKAIHRTHLLVAKEAEGLYRIYIFTT